MDRSHTLMIQPLGLQTCRQVGSLQEPLQPLHWQGSPRFHSRIAAMVMRPVCIGARIVANTVASVAAASLQQSLQPLQAIHKCACHLQKTLQRWIVVIEVLFPGIYKIYPGLQQGIGEPVRLGPVVLTVPDDGCSCRSRTLRASGSLHRRCRKSVRSRLR